MHNASLQEVVEDHSSVVVLLPLVLGHGHLGLLRCKLGLHLVEPGYLGPQLVLFQEVRVLGVSDLYSGPPSLGACLEHMHSSAMEHADLSGGLKGCCYLWVHVDVEPTLHYQLLVPLLHLRLHPVREDVLEDGVHHVGYPLLGHLHHLLAIRQVIVHLWVLV